MLTLVDVAHEGTHAVPEGSNGGPVGLDELCRLAAQQMLAVALEAERRAYLDAHATARDEDGRRLMAGNGHQRRVRSPPPPPAGSR